ncbi:3-deoxy-D-manno-octulosonate 8-phosphate phosphatase (KDO 8-P phosphatase) [Pseudoxanthomonas sp. CF385]|uniref:KdsC family phosphatase n=1 Tax=Pseudoxanthomonas sp. CF385 TaxID=1881042 RepID=UPI0008818CF9|nr:HAD hydrolase family protein [Pseudoxanthomonas sp. CF385]SDQ96231.1 3-deoxy-D-manno-octulosonate 8-phosphate phosphatase (KDO 8-P phosphatase) [Pseudoxanthomonas sp. CF385]
MPLRHLHDLTDDVLARATRIRLACFDVDGTLTDGRIFLDGEGREQKAFHVQDGQGLVLLKRAGIEVAFITARGGTVAIARGRELGVQVFTGTKDKLAKVRELCATLAIGLDEVAFMGDDLPDVPPFDAVGLAIAPADAHPWTARRAHWRTRRSAGLGAAREACDLLLGAQGHAPVFEGGMA